MRTLTRAVVVASLALLAPGCGGHSPAPPAQTVFSAQIDKTTFPGQWPVLTMAGVLACDTTKGAGAVTFTPKGSATTYAINAPALDWGKSLGWPDSKEIGTVDANWGDFIRAGLQMCDEKAGAPPPPVTAVPFTESDLRGFYTPVAFWDKTFTAAPLAECAAQGAEVPTSDPQAIAPVAHAWRLPGGTLACAPEPNIDAAGHLGNVDLYFPDPGVNIHVALEDVVSILPADADDLGIVKTGGPGRPHQSIGCHIEQYSSDTLSAAINRYDPKGAALQDSHKVTVMLYTGRPDAEGNYPPFNQASVHEVAIIAGDADGFDVDGIDLC